MDDDDYDMWRDLAESMPEHPLECALRTNDPGLRCYYWENGGSASGWNTLSAAERQDLARPPVREEPRVASGTFFMYSGDRCVALTEQEARDAWNYSFRAA